MERKKRSKGRGWESCYVKKIYGTFGVKMRAYGQKFCKHTHTRVSYSSIDKQTLSTRAGTNTPSDEYDSYHEYRVANTNMYSRIHFFLRGY